MSADREQNKLSFDVLIMLERHTDSEIYERFTPFGPDHRILSKKVYS